MKSEMSKERPAFDLTNRAEQREQVDSKVISKVFLTNGREYDIVPGTFKFLITPGDRPVPFIQFESRLWPLTEGTEEYMVPHIVEVFPASVAGVAYLKPEE